MAIECIHWGDLGDRTHRGDHGLAFALWPQPVDHDECFQKAGFDCFADTDAAWDADFAILIQDVLAILATYGGPSVTGPSLVQRPFGRPGALATDLQLHERIALVARDDQFASCHADFGAPVRAALHASDGHPILWIWLHREVAQARDSKLRTIARGRHLVETTLRWDALLPDRLFS